MSYARVQSQSLRVPDTAHCPGPTLHQEIEMLVKKLLTQAQMADEDKGRHPIRQTLAFYTEKLWL